MERGEEGSSRTLFQGSPPSGLGERRKERERERERERDSERASERDGDGEMKDNYLCAGRSAPSCDKPLEPCFPDGFIRLKKLQSSQVTASRIIAITAEPKNV